MSRGLMHKVSASILTVILAALCSLASAQQAVEDKYFAAWLFRDYATMYDMASTDGRAGAPRAAFAAAAAQLPRITESPKIISRNQTDDRTAVYFTAVAGAETVRGSLILRPEGIEHPELVALLRQGSTPTSGGAASVDSTVVDGLSLDDILNKMDQAVSKAKTLRAKVTVEGALMGMPIRESGTLLYKAPDQFRLSLTSFIVNSPGSANAVLYSSKSNMVITLGSLGQLEFAPGIGADAAAMKSRYKMRLEGKSTWAGQDSFEIRMSPPQSGIMAMVPAGDVLLHVNAATFMPVGASASGMKFTYADYEIDAAGITDDSFRFQPPASATVLSLDSIMGSMGTMQSPGSR